MCSKEVGLCAKMMMITTLGWTINIIVGVRGGDLYDHLMSTTTFIFVVNKRIRMMSSIIMRNVAMASFWDFLTISY